MFIVLTIIFLILAIGLTLWIKYSISNNDSEYVGDGVVGLGILDFLIYCAFIGCFITIMCFIPKIATESTYDTRIEIVQETNMHLEEQICSAVEKYLEHEENVYEKLNITTAIGLFSAYPNLKSNELVKQLVDTYKANAEEIKELKLEKTNLAIYKFLVYFGH